jgi:uncharacterized protein YbaR (Trm112 family)
MQFSTLDILRCPYCGGRLELVRSLFHRTEATAVADGVLGCQCCVFPIVDGIPVLHLQPQSQQAREQIEAGRPDLARRTMFGLDDPAQAELFDRVAGTAESTYRETVEAFGPNFEGGYFLYRFSDPTFIVAQAVVRAVAGTVLRPADRAIDICGGSGHLTRSLLGLTEAAPLLADLYYAKVWLARRFTAPGCEAVSCDGNAPLPFARGAFRFAMCTDAFMYIWTKRQFVGEMERLVDEAGSGHPGAVLIGHTHNQRTWSPSHGQPLTPEGYAGLFEAVAPRIFAEGGLFADVVDAQALDLSRRDSKETLDADPALTIIASRHPGVFTRHRTAAPGVEAQGEFRLNPLYEVRPAGAELQLSLRFPDEDYAQEYAAARRYLPEEVFVDRTVLDLLPAAALPEGLAELARRRVVLDLPRRYY